MVALLLAIAQLSGCTAIGFVVGAGRDYLNNEKTPERLQHLASNSRVKLRLRNGETLRGVYLGPGAPAPRGGGVGDSAASSSLGDRPGRLAEEHRQSTTARIAVVGRGELEVPWSDIARVDASAPRTGKVFFGLIGLAVDVWFWGFWFPEQSW
jgi:hypothetical protein